MEGVGQEMEGEGGDRHEIEATKDMVRKAFPLNEDELLLRSSFVDHVLLSSSK